MNKIEKVIKELANTYEDFMENMENESFKKGVIQAIEEELTPMEIRIQRGREQMELIKKEGIKAIPIVDTGDDEEAWLEGSSVVIHYFRELKKKK